MDENPKTRNLLEVLEDNPKLLSEKLTLVLDFDGTLTRIRKHADQPRMSRQRTLILKKLVAHPKREVVILSGRPISFLKERVPVIGVRLIPERGIGLNPIFKKNEKDINKALVEVKRILQPLLKKYWGTEIERKPTSIVFHVRNVSESKREEVTKEVYEKTREFLKKTKVLEIVPGRMILEFLPKNMPDKGDSIRQLLKEYPGQMMYAGDDTTDEPALKAVKKHGFGVLIKSREKDLKGTAASYYVNGVGEFTKALKLLAKCE